MDDIDMTPGSNQKRNIPRAMTDRKCFEAPPKLAKFAILKCGLISTSISASLCARLTWGQLFFPAFLPYHNQNMFKGYNHQ